MGSRRGTPKPLNGLDDLEHVLGRWQAAFLNPHPNTQTNSTGTLPPRHDGNPGGRTLLPGYPAAQLEASRLWGDWHQEIRVCKSETAFVDCKHRPQHFNPTLPGKQRAGKRQPGQHFLDHPLALFIHHRADPWKGANMFVPTFVFHFRISKNKPPSHPTGQRRSSVFTLKPKKDKATFGGGDNALRGGYALRE